MESIFGTPPVSNLIKAHPNLLELTLPDPDPAFLALAHSNHPIGTGLIDFYFEITVINANEDFYVFVSHQATVLY